MNTLYTVEYFIGKFSAIPEEKWITHKYSDGQGNYCAYGHCGLKSDRHSYKETTESLALTILFVNAFKDTVLDTVTANQVNDGFVSMFDQPTPKQRVLAALEFIRVKQEREKEQGQVRQKTVYVAVPETITEQAKEAVLS